MNRALLFSGFLGASLAQGAAFCASGHYAFATLENGAHVGFALLRTGTASSTTMMGEVSLPRSNGVSRVLVDEKSRTYFGYRLEVELKNRSVFKVSVQPLASDLAKDLRRMFPCENCPLPSLLAPIPRIPAPRVVSDGDVFTLDLLVNPKTQEKIIDIVKISKSPINVETMKVSSSKISESLRAVKDAEIHMLAGRYTNAVKEFKKALDIYSEDAIVHNKLGICHQRSQRINDAERAFKEALKINPDYAEAWNNLGALDHGRGDYKQAIKHYKKALAVKADFATAYRNMGTAYFALQRFEEGYEAYQTAYRVDPTILDATATMPVDGSRESIAMQCFYVAKIAAANGQTKTALFFLHKAVEVGFKDFKRLKRDPDFKSVVADPRFKQLVEESK
ncbi:MAG: tetratricopeptide repeat protein [Vicinamibacteria bacterium]|nr:tetratricopeptide repeat protein [Vicinamibacteria bacterium]